MEELNAKSVASSTVLQIQLLGPSTFTVGGKELRFKSMKLRAALGYLALSQSQSETRERLAGLLWSEFDEDHARASLRQIVLELRIVLAAAGFGGVYIGRRSIGFSRGLVEVDVLAVIRAAEAGQVHPLLFACRDFANELLAGLEDLDESFSSWLIATRHALRDRLLRALETALSRQAGDLPNQGCIAQAILNLDPTHENAARRLMRARAMMGDTAGALRVYKMLWERLDEDYCMEPAEATQKLVADIKVGAYECSLPEPETGDAMPFTSVLTLGKQRAPFGLSAVLPP